MPQILPDDEITKCINSLNSMQREVFHVTHTWVKDQVKYDRHDIKPVYIVLPGNCGTGKSHFVKVICNAISKTFLYHCKDPDRPIILLLRYTGTSAVIVLQSNQEQSCLIEMTKLKLL